MTEPQMQAFAVTLVFNDGVIFGTTIIAPVREAAMAMAMQQAMREEHERADLAGFALTDLPAEWMRATLRLIEGQPGQVVSLVSDNLRPANPLNLRYPTAPVGGEPV
jgi:hypothetical protein